MKYFPLTTQGKWIRQSGGKSTVTCVNTAVSNASPRYSGVLWLAAVSSEEDKSALEWINGG